MPLEVPTIVIVVVARARTLSCVVDGQSSESIGGPMRKSWAKEDLKKWRDKVET